VDKRKHTNNTTKTRVLNRTSQIYFNTVHRPIRKTYKLEQTVIVMQPLILQPKYTQDYISLIITAIIIVVATSATIIITKRKRK